MDEASSKRERLKAVVLLLIGFIIGFATHAFTTTQNMDIVPSDTSTSTMEDVVSTSTDTGDGQTPAVVTPPTVDATANNAEAEGYTISVKDQTAGNVVHVSQITLDEPAWVAIREDNNGGMGNILGAAWYPQGRHTVSVELLRETTAENINYAVLYVDDGDKLFDFNKDELVVGDDGKLLVTKFRTY